MQINGKLNGPYALNIKPEAAMEKNERTSEMMKRSFSKCYSGSEHVRVQILPSDSLKICEPET